MSKPTREQLAIIRHKGGHARVLAVAGSGKTTTLALRIQHLIEKRGENPRRIRVLTFNRLASKQFIDKLVNLGIRGKSAPFVSTFHSFAYQFVLMAMRNGLIPEGEFWLGQSEEKSRQMVLRIIKDLVKKKKVPEGHIDVEVALEAIGLWKGALIPPGRAGHRSDPYLPLVYRDFEAQRKASRAYTFDDFVPLVIEMLRTNERLSQQWCGRLSYLIVDEYQDVNFGQQTLLEFLGKGAEVMVVGDDDQTIYEWRGARPEYILEQFTHAFSDKQTKTYTLSRSFRFGSMIAECAYNAIRQNAGRMPKKLVAHNKRKKSRVVLLESTDENRVSVHHVMAVELKRLIEKENVPPSEIWVLGRMYAQLSIFESQCLATGIPYKVLGNAPFFKRSEVQKILDYLRVVLAFNEPITPQIERYFLSIANTPNRYLKRTLLVNKLKNARKKGLTLRYYLESLLDLLDPKVEKNKERTIRDLIWVLSKAHSFINASRSSNKQNKMDAGQIMKWIAKNVDYEDHFRNYYGVGEDAFERMETLRNFTDFAQSLGLAPNAFLDYMKTLNSAQGAKEEALITMTTVHKTKGLEFDYVFIPSCQEGYMPCLLDETIAIYDTKGEVQEADLSDTIERERRLFYVALTRARKSVYIGTKYPGTQKREESSLPSRFISEMQIT